MRADPAIWMGGSESEMILASLADRAGMHCT